MSLLVKVVLVFFTFNPLISYASLNSETVLHQSILSREVIKPSGETDIQVSADQARMVDELDCAQHDADDQFEDYRLEVITQAPSKRSAAAITKWMGGLDAEDTLSRVTIQTCIGIGPVTVL